MGPSLNGISVTVTVGVLVGVGVGLGAGVTVGGWVCVAGGVGMGVKVVIPVAVVVGLAMNAFTDEFFQIHAAARRRPIRRLTIQNPITNRRRFLLDEETGMPTRSLARCGAASPGRY